MTRSSRPRSTRCAGASFLTATDDNANPRPIGPPDDANTSHPLTYADGTTIHYGDQAVTASDLVVELDVTDDGVVVRTDDGGIWFTDGADLDQIGTLGDPGQAYDAEEHPYGTTWGFVVSANTGSRVAWLEFPQPGQPELVVYDTRSGEQSARHNLQVAPGAYALLGSVTERFAYWYDNPKTVADDIPIPDARLDLATGSQGPVTREQYESDNPGPGTPRSVMVSHIEGGGPPYQVIDGTGWQFAVRGGRLDPQGAQPLDARDGATRKRFAFDALAGYPHTNPTWLTQWLDDDTVVLVATRGGMTTCSSATSPPGHADWRSRRRRGRSCPRLADGSIPRPAPGTGAPAFPVRRQDRAEMGGAPVAECCTTVNAFRSQALRRCRSTAGRGAVVGTRGDVLHSHRECPGPFRRHPDPGGEIHAQPRHGGRQRVPA